MHIVILGLLLLIVVQSILPKLVLILPILLGLVSICAIYWSKRIKATTKLIFTTLKS